MHFNTEHLGLVTMLRGCRSTVGLSLTPLKGESHGVERKDLNTLHKIMSLHAFA
jgi:hypothetical protein